MYLTIKKKKNYFRKEIIHRYRIPNRYFITSGFHINQKTRNIFTNTKNRELIKKGKIFLRLSYYDTRRLNGATFNDVPIIIRKSALSKS